MIIRNSRPRRGYGDYGIEPVTTAAAATGLVNTVVSLFGGKKTVAAQGEIPGLLRLGQDGSNFILTSPAEVIVIAPNGAQASKMLAAGTYPCSGFLGRDLQKGASKACYLRQTDAAAVTGATYPALATALTSAGAAAVMNPSLQPTAEQVLLAQQAAGVPTQSILAGFDPKSLLVPGAIGLALFAVLSLRKHKRGR